MNDFNLEHYYTSVYDEADRFTTIRKVVFSCIFMISMLAVVIKVDYLLYFSAASLVALQILASFFKAKIDGLYMLGHNLQKHSMLVTTLPQTLDHREITRLKGEVSLSVEMKVQEKITNNVDSVVYDNEDSYSGIEKLMKMIHENSFLNSQFYKYKYEYSKKILIVSGFSCFILLIVFLPFLKNDDLLILMPKFGFAILSLGVIYEIFEETVKTKKTADLMASVDSYLCSILDSDHKDEIIIDVFSRYNEAKLITPNIPSSIYIKHSERVKNLWKSRFSIQPLEQ